MNVCDLGNPDLSRLFVLGTWGSRPNRGGEQKAQVIQNSLQIRQSDRFKYYHTVSLTASNLHSVHHTQPN